MAHEIGAGALAEEVGVPIRTIQFWTDTGVLQAIPESDRQGRGKPRLYRADPPFYGERAYARIAAELHKLRVSVGLMREIIQLFREGERRPPYEKKTPGRNAFEAGFQGIYMAVLFTKSEVDAPLQVTFNVMNFEYDSGYLLNLTRVLSTLSGRKPGEAEPADRDVYIRSLKEPGSA
jgi:DNA-binding transcriptional MerR regulator